MQITVYVRASLPEQPETAATVEGDTLTWDGVSYDLSAVPEGGAAMPEGDHPFVGDITRVDGEIRVGIRWYYDAASAVEGQGDTPPVFEISDGAIPDPVIRRTLE